LSFLSRILGFLKTNEKREEENIVAEKIRKSICPNCGASKWLLGPRGGLARNIKCAECGEVYNILSCIGVEWRGKVYFFKESKTCESVR